MLEVPRGNEKSASLSSRAYAEATAAGREPLLDRTLNELNRVLGRVSECANRVEKFADGVFPLPNDVGTGENTPKPVGRAALIDDTFAYLSGALLRLEAQIERLNAI